jgi:hypothetical protein
MWEAEEKFQRSGAVRMLIFGQANQLMYIYICIT